MRKIGPIAAFVAAQTIVGPGLAAPSFELRVVDDAGRRVDPKTSHASLQRTPPDRLGDDPYRPTGDPDALRFLVVGPAAGIPTTLTLSSIDESGNELDRLSDLALGHVPCPADVAKTLVCGSTVPIRAVTDDIDRNHPTTLGRSLRAALGGALIVTRGDTRLLSLRVAGPRTSPAGPIERYRATMRMFLVRLRPGGPPPFGSDAPSAIALARAEAQRATDLWSACGITFGPAEAVNIAVVDPPPSHLLAIGCDLGLPASGGALRFTVDGRAFSLDVPRGALPDAVARRAAALLARAGFDPIVSDNAVVGSGVYGTSDVLVRRPNGALAEVRPPVSGALSSDATLRACVGRVDLDDGLQHFGDGDAIAGTVEERTLIKAFDDGDPSTIEVYLIPGFGGGGRIGESFIFADGGGIRNAVIEDRAALRADRASFALAHELGHVLLDEPGHPDDFGVDTPTRLMDADSVNGSAYGPRRLLLDECARALRQSGPQAPSSVLTPWPLGELR